MNTINVLYSHQAWSKKEEITVGIDHDKSLLPHMKPEKAP